MYSIRLATAQEALLLPAIEAAASRLFDNCVITAGLPLYPTPVENYVEAQQQGLLWVAVTAQNLPVGFAWVERFENVAHLAELDVLPAYGQRGIGAALVRHVCEWTAAQGLDGVTLTTFRDIPWNAPFYMRLGFRVLPPTDWSPALRQRVAEEVANGLPQDLRVVMRRNSAQKLS